MFCLVLTRPKYLTLRIVNREPEEEDGVYMFGLLPAHYVSLRGMCHC